jgi:hypothetical protein
MLEHSNFVQMPRTPIRNGNGAPRTGANKYDAHNKVLSQTYGAFADLRRELSDSKTTVGEREEILRTFAACPDSQRAWLALEDYFEKLSLSRRDFPQTDWWTKMLAATGKARLEELAFLFLRAKRSVPPELQPHANLDRFAQAEEVEQELQLVRELENWLSPPSNCNFYCCVRARAKKRVRSKISWTSSSAPRTNRNCSRRRIGNSSSGFTTRIANAPMTPIRCC